MQVSLTVNVPGADQHLPDPREVQAAIRASRSKCMWLNFTLDV